MNLNGDLRCEDIFKSELPNNFFDLVYSIGVIEHFNDPRDIVQRHIDLLKPGGKAIIAIPNYGGIYGRLQKYYDAENLAIHNVEIMQNKSLLALVDNPSVKNKKVYAYGKFDPSIISWHKKMPALLAKAIPIMGTMIGHISPYSLGPYSPWLILEIDK